MWPKVFAQLVELLPHVTRLIPMADVFFATKTASEKANEAALAALANDVHTDLTGVSSAYDSLYRQLQSQSAQIAEVENEVRRTRAAVEEQIVHTTALQQQLIAFGLWIKTGVALLGVVLALATALLIVVLRSR